ncbi:MAG: alpha/beta hydrolase [Rhodospirillales bacterium]|nr:alpha/beta hydrolase [Acetobacter sp.]
MSGYADIFIAKGYGVLLPDSREHGESGGRVATFGLLESDDVRRWASWVKERSSGCMYVLGESMGAAIAVQAAAVTPGICAAAVEDPFARFRQEVYERLGHETRLGTRFWRTAGWPVVQTAIEWAHFRYRVWLPDAAPASAIAHSSVPVLLMTGTADRNVPMHHAEDLEKICGSRCALWVVPGADHGGISTKTGAEFGHRILVWYQTHDLPGATPVLEYANADHMDESPRPENSPIVGHISSGTAAQRALGAHALLGGSIHLHR